MTSKKYYGIPVQSSKKERLHKLAAKRALRKHANFMFNWCELARQSKHELQGLSWPSILKHVYPEAVLLYKPAW